MRLSIALLALISIVFSGCHADHQTRQAQSGGLQTPKPMPAAPNGGSLCWIPGGLGLLEFVHSNDGKALLCTWKEDGVTPLKIDQPYLKMSLLDAQRIHWGSTTYQPSFDVRFEAQTENRFMANCVKFISWLDGDQIQGIMSITIDGQYVPAFNVTFVRK